MAKPTVAQKVRLASPFAAVAGYTDVITITKYKCYASIMTGNLMQFAQFVGDADWHGTIWFIIMVVSINMLGVVTYHTAKSLNKYGTTIIAPIGALMIGAVQILEYREVIDDSMTSRFQVFILTFIFGIQNAMSTDGIVGAPTTLCTGHIGIIAEAFQKVVSGQRAKVQWDRFKVSSAVVVAFLCGAVFGQQVMRYTVFTWMHHFLFLPAVILLFAVILINDRIDARVASSDSEVRLQEPGESGVCSSV